MVSPRKPLSAGDWKQPALGRYLFEAKGTRAEALCVASCRKTRRKSMGGTSEWTGDQEPRSNEGGRGPQLVRLVRGIIRQSGSAGVPRTPTAPSSTRIYSLCSLCLPSYPPWVLSCLTTPPDHNLHEDRVWVPAQRGAIGEKGAQGPQGTSQQHWRPVSL